MNILITGAWRNCDCNIERIKHIGHNVVFMQKENDSLPCEYDWVCLLYTSPSPRD